MLSNINLNLTTACPLRCKQCYCNLEKPQYMSKEVAIKWISDAKENGVKNLSLSGGETLCYPYLYDVILFAKESQMNVSASFSGWSISHHTINKLIKSGIDNICISLNGSNESINALTRDGYKYAIDALELLNTMDYKSSVINWVMHSNNTYDFPNIISIAEKYGVRLIDVIAFKPDSHAEMKTVPSKEQIYWIADVIKEYRGNVKIGVEACYSQLNTILLDTKLFGNLNFGHSRGCRAGISVISVNVDGSVSPCRHIHYQEQYDSISDYFNLSPIVHRIRECNESSAELPCSKCEFLYNCKPCMAINTEVYNTICWSNEFCTLFNERK